MGFFAAEIEAAATQLDGQLKGHSVDFLHKHQCAVCPLNHQAGLRHPQMKPTGSKQPLVYILGEAPGRDEDEEGRQFVGRSGKVLRQKVPREWLPELRWNNCVRTRPPNNRIPTAVEIECCRPSVVADIEQSKPDAIFGFGAVALDWALKESRITNWSGRRVPVKVGTHTCWFFPMVHPSYAMREINKGDKDKDDWDFGLKIHMRNAFREVGRGLPKPVVWTAEDFQRNVTLVTGAKGKADVKRIRDILDKCWDEPYVGFDWETNGLRPYAKGAKICTVGIATMTDAYSFPLRHSKATWSHAELDEIEEMLYEFLVEAKCRKVSHRLSFEGEWAAFFFGRESVLDSEWEDTESQAFLLDERTGGAKSGVGGSVCHSLDFLCLQYFGMRIKQLSKVDRKNIDNMPLEQVLRYNAIDAKAHLHLFHAQTARLKEQGLWKLYRVHLPRVLTMVLTQIKGVPIDQPTVAKFAVKYDNQLADYEQQIEDLKITRKFEKRFGYKFEPSNNKHVAQALELAGLDLEKVDEKHLSKADHPLAKLILKWRKPAKLLSTYVKPVMLDSPHIYPDGLMHPIINTTKTANWRTSSEDPNAQNWPKRGPNKVIRKQIKPKAGHKVVAFDYAGIQARNVAMESLDRGLVRVYWEHYDIHGDWVRRLARRVPSWRSKKELADKDQFKEIRSMMKNKFVFPSFFGSQEKSISADLGITERQARGLQDEFFQEFPDVKGWQERLVQTYNRTGYVTGLTGYRRRAPISVNELINSPIQADESLIVCNSMIALSQTGDEQLQANFMIHDDLTFFWHEKDVDKNIDAVLAEMLVIEYDWINVPLEVEVSIGDNWCDLKEIGKFEAAPGKKGYWEVKG